MMDLPHNRLVEQCGLPVCLVSCGEIVLGVQYSAYGVKALGNELLSVVA